MLAEHTCWTEPLELCTEMAGKATGRSCWASWGRTAAWHCGRRTPQVHAFVRVRGNGCLAQRAGAFNAAVDKGRKRLGLQHVVATVALNCFSVASMLHADHLIKHMAKRQQLLAAIVD